MENINTVLFIKGPDTPFPIITFTVEALKKEGVNVVVVGDGSNNIDMAEMETALKSIKNEFLVIANFHGLRPFVKGKNDPISENYNALGDIQRRLELEESNKRNFEALLKEKNDKAGKDAISHQQKVKFIQSKLEEIQANKMMAYQEQVEIYQKIKDLIKTGMNEDDLQKKLAIRLNDDDYTLTQFFELIKTHHPKTRFDVVLGSCYGAFGHTIAPKYLQPDACFMSWGTANRMLHVDVISSFVTSLAEGSVISSYYNHNFTAEAAFIDYLVSDYDSLLDWQIESIPNITINGKIFYPEKHLIYGREFSEEEKRKIDDQLHHFVQKQDLSTHLEKLQTACSVDEVKQKGRFGLSLAIASLLRDKSNK